MAPPDSCAPDKRANTSATVVFVAIVCADVVKKPLNKLVFAPCTTTLPEPLMS